MAVMLLGMMSALLPQESRAASENDLDVLYSGEKSYYVLRNNDDWLKFQALVKKAGGDSDVNAIMDADFSITQCVGLSNWPYRGTFNGNGHTLTLNIDCGEEAYGAIFPIVKDVTVRDLVVKGDVKGGLHSAAIVGGVSGKPTLTFERVKVTATVTSCKDHIGGFVGHSGDADVVVTDCDSYGYIYSTCGTESVAGAVIGWGNNGGSWTMHRVYEFVSFGNEITHAGFSYWNKAGSGGYDRAAWGYNDKSTLCLSKHNFGEMRSGCKNIETNQVVDLMNAEKDGSWAYNSGVLTPVMDVYQPDATFETYDMIPGTESGEEGILKIPFSCDQAVKWIDVSYTDENGNPKNMDRITFPKNTYAGFLKVPATEQHKNLKFTVKLLVGSISATYDEKNDAVMHNPRNLTAELLSVAPSQSLIGSQPRITDAGAVQLQWNVKDPDYKEVVDGDQFVVMRSLTGKKEDYVPIGNVVIENNASTYAYKDSLLTSALTAELMDETQGSLVVHYVVVRAAAQQLWGIENVASATVGCQLSQLHLLRIADYNAQWENEADKTVSVTWQYGEEYGAVWDSRAQLKILVTSTNRKGVAVDSTTYVLTADEMTACRKVVTLKRSCVNYKIEFIVDPATSPILTEVPYVNIRSAEDWATFVSKVKEANGQKDVYAQLMADITVSEPVGESASLFFQGVFEGNGYTLTFNPKNWTEQYIAPFRYVGNAIIRNLHTAGSITTSQKFAAGLIARQVDNTIVLIEGCHTSMDINSTVNGDATNGGIVANAGGNTQTIVYNSKFDGRLRGINCYANGGIMGYSIGQVTIENCLFAPTELNTKYESCNTWSRIGGLGKLTLTNSYCTREYGPLTVTIDDDVFHVLRDAADWEYFRQAVENADGEQDVNAIMVADFTVNTIVGSSADKAFRGIFNGNGHTLDVSLDGNKNEYIAPFGHVKDSKFWDVRVTGSVRGGNHASGLIGSIEDGANVYIYRVRMSADITTTADHLGGLIGHGHNSSITVYYSLFDGSFSAPDGSNTYGGAFIGWTHATNGNVVSNYEHGTYNNIAHASFCYWYSYGTINDWGSCNWYSMYNNAAASQWTEMGEDYYGNHRYGITDPSQVLKQLNSDSWHNVDGKVLPVMRNRELPEINPKSDDELLAALGDGWKKDADGKPVPRTTDKSKTIIPDLPDFYYENLGHIDQNSLRIQKLPTSALLSWSNVDDEPVDYYEVWRRDVNEPVDSVKCIATQLRETEYEDKTTSPVHQYEYFVRGVCSCEGEKYDDTKPVQGMCVQTATVEGYLRFLDGTGIPGKKVITTVDNDERSVVTDESGFFRLSGLPYVDGRETSYKLTTTLNGVEPMTVTFGTKPGDNVVKDVVFEIGESVKIAGYVQYNGTSIPVQGVSFLVDGYEVRTAGGKVETDHEGKFAFRIMKGSHDSIQAVKDGHVFYRGGFYHENDDDPDSMKAYEFTTDKAGVMFYDDTRVKLIGRIAGGKEQGAIPLGNSLSRNNLGDELQMVLILEGDNASRLVWDIQDRNKKERDEEFIHKAHDTKFEYKTKVHTTLNRMVVSPDVHTGEYEVLLPPVKWKIQQITAKGYPTLFQDGQVGDVIDLSDSITLHKDTVEGEWMTAYGVAVNSVEVEYNAQYSRIYHSPVIIDYVQQGYDPFSYFGDRYYSFKNVDGISEKLSLAYGVRKKDWPVGKRDSLETLYTFGYPVFSIDKKYGIKISATERYYYNNNTKSDTVDVIRLSGGEVTIHNGMVSSTHKDVVQLDSLGEALYTLEAAQTPYLLTGKEALRTVSMTLLMDGTHYEANPLRAYILNIKTKEGAKDIINYSTPQLIDILRDPPGGASKATLSKGSTLKYSYTMDMKWSAGVGINIGVGSGVNAFTGVVVAPMGAGAVGGVNNAGQSYFGTSIDLVWSGSGQRAFNYTMTAKEDISTSSDKKLVGANGDLYMGVVQNIVVKPATAIRAIPDSVFRLMDGMLKGGRTVEIAQGRDERDSLIHLVRDEVVTYGPKIQSDFVHSQEYIVKQLIPSLTEHILSLMFTGTEAEAQAQADATGKPVYLSLASKDDPDFGTSYKMIVPKGAPDNTENEVARYQQNMLKWVEMIAQNEKEKLEATDLVKNFDIDGGGSLNYSETFTSDYSVSNSFVSPITAGTAGYFDNTAGDATMGVVAIVGPVVAKILTNILKGSAGKTSGETGLDGDEGGLKVSVDAVGFTFKFSLSPAMSFSVTPKNTESKSYTRTESFSIAMDKKSHLDFDVYRVKTKTDDLKSANSHDVFYNSNFYDMVDYDYDHMKDEVNVKNFTYARSFVYRTRAGATCRPWENERKTLFHEPGTQLDERTKKIENPVIKMDKQSLSGVPFGEPARFKLYLANESEQPEAAYIYFDLYQNETANPDGAKMMIDGIPLSGSPRTMEIHPGQVTEKTLEVYAGEKFDYEGLKIGLISQGDIDVFQEVSFDVHYIQTAGSIVITTPGDNWIMNCDAPFEKGKGWYLPVIISDFDKNQHNFDHIEFQYKESTRGDDYWTNLCGYYADSVVYRAATGTKEMIPENGNIIARFFGDGQEMEKAYDLRAVLFCRNGNAFLTNHSKTLTGVKDTRRPQLFGTPEPKSGVLGAGDNIIFNFSEDIEYNYLQTTTNFEVKGETNETAIQEAPSLLFGGKGYAQTEARRNFADKSMTIEVMIKPDDTGEEMPIFSHGTDGKYLQLWLSGDKRLKAVVENGDEPVFVESETPLKGTGFQRVAMVLDNEKKQLMLYSDEQLAKTDSIVYSGYGPLTFGFAETVNSGEPFYYKGRMLQGRVWHRALDLATLNRYGDKLLTGYELGLIDYYPMNEGKGSYAHDYAQGADMMLNGATWALPQGMSLKLDKNQVSKTGGTKGRQLLSKFFERDEEQDYTLMFWFNTSESNGTLFCNGSGNSTDEGAENKFFIGFEDHTLLYRTNGTEYELGDMLCDGAWHHYAMTMNRQRKVGSIYIDNELKTQFVADTIGGMQGTGFYLGNMVWQNDGDPTVHEANALTGFIDGIALFEQALPVSLINRYSSKSPGGAEKGLIVYLDFDRQERQKSGALPMEPYVLSKVVKYDKDGKETDQHDSVFVDPVKEMLECVDQKIGAPMQAYEELRNLNFSFVGRDNQLLVNVDEQDARINKRNIYVTVSDIPDKNGNYMASPATECFFVNRNPLTWNLKHYVATIQAGYEYEIDLEIINDGGKSHTYTISNLPRWMSVNKTSDIVDAQSRDKVTVTISKDINVGTYDHIIYLTDEDGLSEPLSLELTIEGEKPYWFVNQDLKRYSMNVVAQVYVGNTLVTDSRDIVAAFDENGRCMGVDNVKYDPTTGRSMVYLTVYDNTTVANKLFFRLWHYTTGKTMQLRTSKDVRFGDQSIEGTIANPVQMYADNLYLQHIYLEEGWNWISFNVYNTVFEDASKLLSMYPWKNGDIVTEDTEDMTLSFKNGKWISNSSKSISDIKVSQEYCYRLKVQDQHTIEIWGESLKQPEKRTIHLKKGWNSIGYTPMVNLPVATALTEYLGEASDGDVIKCQHEFAMFKDDGAGGGEWLGTMEYMKPGNGYMLYRQKEGETQFRYPYYEPGTSFVETSTVVNATRKASRFVSTMSVVAQAIGIDIQEGDRLVAYACGEQVGEAVLSPLASRYPSLFFLSIGGDVETPLSFVVERDGAVLAVTGEVMTYEANAVSGRLDAPTQINFTPVDQLPQKGWYTLQGIKLQNAPKQSGVFIHNGHKQVMK